MIGKFIKATATYDKANKKVYATVNSAIMLPFSIGGHVLAILDRSSFLARVGKFETLGDTATMELLLFDDNDDNMVDSLFNSRSEKTVLLKGLSNSKELERPSLLIDVAAVPNAVVLSALKEQIALGTITFAQAVEMAVLNSSSQVTTIFNSGNPKTMYQTYVADKVKAKFSTKGLEILSDRKRGQVITSDQPVKLVSVFNYFRTTRQELREQQAVFIYIVSLVDENLNVVLNKQPIKEVIKFKNNEEIGYRLKFEDEFNAQFSGTYTVLIEKSTVTNTDYIGWTGSSEIPDPSSLGLWNQEGPLKVEYLKKYDGIAFDYLELEFPESALGFILHNKLAVVTFGKKNIYGALNLTEDNKVQFTKPANVSALAWFKDLAAIQSSGTGILVQVEQGYPAQAETLQLKVDLGNVESAWDIYRQLQAILSLTVGQLLPIIEQFNVLNADVAAAKAGVNILTGIETLATGTVKWFTDANCFEIAVQNNSRKTFNMFNSNGIIEGFQEVNAGLFLDAVVADVKETYQLELQNIINPTSASDNVVWRANIQVNGESYWVPMRNAEVIRSTSGTTYRLYHQEIPQLLIEFVNHGPILVLTRTESLVAL